MSGRITRRALTLGSAATLLRGAAPEIFEATGKPDVPLIGLRSPEAEALISPRHGAELSSFRVRRGAEMVELLYRGADYRPTKGWTGRAPLLWPATGRSWAGQGRTGRKDAGYLVQDEFYPMPDHGFVREMPWTVENKSAVARSASVSLTRTDTPDTRRMYPFGFLLRTTHTLLGRKLEIRYDVEAARGNKGPMPFSIGNHISFRTPLLPGTQSSEMQIVTPADYEITKSPDRLPDGGRRAWPGRNRPVKLGELPAASAVSLGGYTSPQPSLTFRDPGGIAVRIQHNADSLPEGRVVLFNLWCNEDRSCFCPEPWVGLQNSLNLEEGLVRLAPGQKWTWRFSVEA